MRIKLKWIMLFELVLIMILLFLFFGIYYKYYTRYNLITNNDGGLKLLSPRIYSGILEPKNFLIVNYAPLRNNIASYIEKNNLNVSVYVENLRNGAFIGIDERKGYPAASLNKLVIAMAIMKMVEDKKLALNSMIYINDSYRSDSYGDLYQTAEKKLPLKILIEKMLRDSDDTAFRVLNGFVDKNDMSLLFGYFDYYSAESVDKTRPGEDYEYGLVTPKSTYNIFSSLYLSSVLEQKDSEYILSLLTDTVFNIKKIAHLPDNVTVAQKFAIRDFGNEKYFHNCGIIYFEQNRIFYCIMTKDLDPNYAIEVIGVIVNGIYEYTRDIKSALDIYKR